MATTKLVLLPWKIKKNKLTTVYLRITKNRKLQYISLGVTVDPTQWDKEEGRVTSKHPFASKINILLSQKALKAQEAILGAEIRVDNPSPRTIKNVIKGISGVKFFKYADEFIETYKVKNKIGTYNRFKAVISKMRVKVDDENFPLDNLTLDFIKSYENYLRKKLENCTNTIHANLKAIKRIVNEAVKDGYLTPSQNPFNNYTIAWQNTEKVFLTEEELLILENHPLVVNSMKYHHRNMYVFACYTGGIRISDLIQLRWSNFNGTHITLSTKKTGTAISVKVPTKAIEILNLYKNEETKQDDFIFPFIDKKEDLTNAERLHQLISSITSFTNSDLKEIAKAAKIKKHVHFHTSRHTWATRALKKGMRIEYVSKLMGHTNISTTQIYAKIVNADLDEAMDVFEDKPPTLEEEVKEKKKEI